MTLTYLVIWVLASWTLITLGVLWYADTLYASAYRANRSNLPLSAQPLLKQASALNATEPIYRDELSSSLATLAVMAAEGKQASQASQLAQLSLLENDAAISISPRNVNFWKTRTKIFYQLATYDPKLILEAIKALEVAKELSPNDPKILYNLAILYGRNNQSDLAIQTLLTAKEMKPNYREVYNALHVFYTDLKETVKAQAVLSEYLTKVDPQDRDFQEKLKQ